MNIEDVLAYCLEKPGVSEHLPFGPDVLVMKVGGKVFLLAPLNTPSLQFNLKCDPELALELREQYASVQPGYHMNKKHWNTITVDGSVSEKTVLEWIDHSYDLVLKSLPKRLKEQLSANK